MGMSNEAILEEIREMISDLKGKLDHMESMLEDFVTKEQEESQKGTCDIPDEAIVIDLEVQDSFDEIPEPESVSEPEPEPQPEQIEESAEEVEDLPESEPEPEASPEATPEPASEAIPEPVPESVNDKAALASATSLKEAISASAYAWKVDMPGAEVKNILSGISLNDRILFINTLFSEDPFRFQTAIMAFNSMTSLTEAEEYIAANYPDWNLNSEMVYRFMMAVRRKLR